MDILGVGGWEVVAILVIALVVAGPARMLRWSYVLGQFFAKLRVLWAQAAASLQKEFDEAGMDIQVPKDVPTRQTLRRDLTNMVNPLLRDVREPLDEFTEEVRKTRAEVRGVITSLKPLKGSGSMSDPMGTRPAKPAEPTTPPASLPSDLGTWGAMPTPTPTAEKHPLSAEFGTWAQSQPVAEPDTDNPAPTGEN